MAKLTATELKNRLSEAFGIEQFNSNQLWALVILAKHVRLRARNNSAFNNLMNGMFPNANFKEVIKTRLDGQTYKGLSIEVDGEAPHDPTKIVSEDDE